MIKLIKIILVFGFFSNLFACTKRKSEEASVDLCALPAGTAPAIDGRYIKGPITVPLGGGASAQIDLYVQRLVKTSANDWTNEIVATFSETGKTPCQTFDDVKAMWQSYYQDMLDAGVHSAVIQKHVDALTNPRNDPDREYAGVYAEAFLGSCGFNGLAGGIYCGLESSALVKFYFVAHENTHGFQWESNRSDDLQNIALYRIFAKYANDFYSQSLSDPSLFTPVNGDWTVGTMDYALQNEVEFIAEVFPGFLYGGDGHWVYLKNNFSQLKSFFECVWNGGNSMTVCQSSSGVAMVNYAQKIPTVSIPVVSGFTQAESEAIWNVCFNTASSSTYVTAFNNLIERLTPGRYANSSSNYELGYGDCNHDGYVDWICSYKGPAPDGGSYLWNTNNQVGAYTFIASGKTGDFYAEYKQDPYLNSATVQGSLVQPMYREWQGTFGSCNGAKYFNEAPTRFPVFAQGISGLPSELVNKTDW